MTCRLAPPVPVEGRRREPLAVTSWALMANTVTTSALGVVFWAVASRLYSPQQLGESAAMVSAMILLSTVSQLNLSMGIPRLLPQVQERRWRPVLGAYALTAAVGAVLTGGFILLLVPHLPDGFAFLAHNRGLGLALAGAVILWNIFALQDAVLTSARWAAAVPIENGLFGLLKIALMVLLADGLIDHGVFFAWFLGMALLLLPVNGLIFGRVLPSAKGRQKQGLDSILPLGERRRITSYLVTDYAAALLSQGSTALLPLLVIGVLGRADNAYFYVTFLISAAMAALAHSLSTSLVAEGAHDESDLRSLAIRSIVRYATFVAPAVVLAILAAPLLLTPFGDAYVTNGTTLLRLLLAGTIPQALVTLYLGVERVRARVSRVLGVEAVTVVLTIAGALFGMRVNGLVGLGAAWLIAQTSVALLVIPRLWRAVRGTSIDSGDIPATEVTMATGASPDLRPLPAAAFATTTDRVNFGVVLVTATLLVLIGLGVTGPSRVVLALIFVSFMPGWTLLSRVRWVEGASRVALSVALSLALGAAATACSLWLHLWHPRGLLHLAAVICLFATLGRLALGGRSPAPSTVQSLLPLDRTTR